jgi:predicted transcriptional regulator
MLTLKEIQRVLGGELLTPVPDDEKVYTKVFASDLMSDVLAFIDPGSVLVTGLVNAHVVRTATLADVSAIVFVQGKRPDARLIDEARLYRLPILTTSCSMFEACSRLSRSLPEGRR